MVVGCLYDVFFLLWHIPYICMLLIYQFCGLMTLERR